MAKATNQKQPEFYYHLQESKAYLVLRLLALQLIIGLIAIVINIFFASTPQLDDRAYLISGLSFAHILLQGLNVVLAILVIVAWLHRAYIITPQEVLVQDGMVAVGRTVFNVEKIDLINVQQSIIGGLFNFGTVTFSSPGLKEEVRLSNIPEPFKYASILENSRIGAEPPNVISH